MLRLSTSISMSFVVTIKSTFSPASFFMFIIVGIPTFITGFFIVFWSIMLTFLLNALPGDNPVVAICIVFPSLSVLSAFSESNTTTKSTSIIPVKFLMKSVLFILVLPSTFLYI